MKKVANRLSIAQKRELELLKAADGYCKIYDQRRMKIFENLRRKGYVKIASAWGQLSIGKHVYLRKEV